MKGTGRKEQLKCLMLNDSVRIACNMVSAAMRLHGNMALIIIVAIGQGQSLE